MSVNTTNHTSVFAGTFDAIGTFFSKLGKAIIASRGLEQRMARVDALQAKSDDELAALGLRRDQIAQYVFKDLFYA